MKRYIFALLLGLLGAGLLFELGFWQLRRLEWKTAMLAEISAQAQGPAQELPASGTDTRGLKYQPVEIDGASTGQEILVLTGQKGLGAGFEVISAFETGAGRRILLDRGFVAEAKRDAPRPATALIVQGNLHWPEEADSYTPPPDAATGLWYARDVAAMAESLGTEPVLVVAARVAGDAQGITPRPLGVEGIPNDHFGYALTWFSLGFVWLGMTAFLIWRIRRQQN